MFYFNKLWKKFETWYRKYVNLRRVELFWILLFVFFLGGIFFSLITK